jgi:flagellar hook assembly protein FlgD
LATAADLIDSAVVVEAYGPDGKPLNLAKRLTTAVGKARAMMNGAPVERVRGKQRTLAFNLGRAQRVQAWVMDLSGRRVAGIVDRKMPAGVHEITWDGMAEGGKPLAKGTYLLRLQAGGFAYDSKVEVGP